MKLLSKLKFKSLSTFERNLIMFNNFYRKQYNQSKIHLKNIITIYISLYQGTSFLLMSIFGDLSDHYNNWMWFKFYLMNIIYIKEIKNGEDAKGFYSKCFLVTDRIY